MMYLKLLADFEYTDVPVADIESGKFEVTFSKGCFPKIIARNFLFFYFHLDFRARGHCRLPR